MYLDFSSIIEDAWKEFSPKENPISIIDISARVSTNHGFDIHTQG